jgi:hypothetical protein
MTRISALLVTYNHGAFIQETIGSVFAQTHAVDEVVVTDDGSSDDTLERVRAIGDRRIRILALPHRGVEHLAETYNTGIAECTGDVIAMLEGDDRWPARKLESQLRGFEDPRVVLAHGRYAVIGARGTLLHPGVAPQIPIPSGAYDPLPYILRGNYIMPVTVIARADTLRAVGGFSQLGGSHGDYPTWLAMAERGWFHNQPTAVGEWRRHDQSIVYLLAGAPSAAAEQARQAIAARERSGRSDLPSVREIERMWLEHRARAVWSNARVLLIEGRFAEARALVGPALLLHSSRGMRLRLLLVAVGALLHVSIEPLARLVTGRSVFSELHR